MKRVQMFTHISGGRGDGSDWPPAGGVIELDDDEAAHIVAARLGRYMPDEERAVPPPDDTVEDRPAQPKRASRPKQA